MPIDLSAANPQRDIVDLRSDTVTRPTAAMYEAMLAAPLGDDVLGDDPTVIRLETMAAERLGKEAALFVSSGTMGNQLAILCQTERGDAILVHEEAHIMYYECGAPGTLGGVVTWTLPGEGGVIPALAVESHILRRDLHSPGTALLCLENTHQRAGGTVVPLAAMAAYREIADRHDLKIHVDGARIFNAAAALGRPVADLAKHADSITFCLSKGLGAPVGSMLCGSRETIDKARMWRKRLGGGLRQSGLLAACGIVALETMTERLAKDHARARRLADALAGIPGIRVEPSLPATNMVWLTTAAPAGEWQGRLRDEGVWCLSFGPNRLRFVFHADIDDAKLDRAIAAFGQISR